MAFCHGPVCVGCIKTVQKLATGLHVCTVCHWTQRSAHCHLANVCMVYQGDLPAVMDSLGKSSVCAQIVTSPPPPVCRFRSSITDSTLFVGGDKVCLRSCCACCRSCDSSGICASSHFQASCCKQGWKGRGGDEAALREACQEGKTGGFRPHGPGKSLPHFFESCLIKHKLAMVHEDRCAEAVVLLHVALC